MKSLKKNQPQPDMNKGEIKTNINDWVFKSGSKRIKHPYMGEDLFSSTANINLKSKGDLRTHYPNGVKFEM